MLVSSGGWFERGSRDVPRSRSRSELSSFYLASPRPAGRLSLNPAIAVQLGVSVQGGVVVLQTTAGGPAAGAGLRR
jgi:hypothetical protein